MKEEVFKTHCSRMDHGGCGLKVYVQEERVTRIEGDPDSPISHGYICPKGLATKERLNHPDRLVQPLVREGNRGEDKWQPVDWAKAMDILTQKLLEVKDRWGSQSVLFGQGAPKGLEFFLLLRLANAFGSPNVAGPQHVCHMPREVASSLTCGFWPDVDYDHPPACLILWGSNLEQTNEEGMIRTRMRKALDAGAKLIVVDPRKTRTAEKADIWLRIRPGSDTALALGMLKVIIEEGLEDKDFVQTWTHGFDELRARLDDYPLSRVEEATWIPEPQIREAARLYAQTKPAAIQWGNALEHNINSHQNCRAVLCLMAMTGNLEAPGGNYHAGYPPTMSLRDFVLPGKIPDRAKKMLSASWHLSPMLATVPTQLATKTILEDDPYPVKAMILHGSNPLVSYPDSKAVREALERVDFLAVTDIFLTPTAALADLVLPAATHFEFDDMGFYGMAHGFIQARPRIVPPPGEAWSDLRIINELGKSLGLQESFWEDEREMLDQILAPSGLDYEAFKEKGVLWAPRRYQSYKEKGFKTPSGKVELYCNRLEKMGLDPLPAFDDPVEVFGGLSEEFPFLLTSAKNPVYFHSANRQISSLRKISGEPLVEISGVSAETLGIEEGDWVCIKTNRGEIRQRARLVDGMDPKVIAAAYGWWFPEQGPSDQYGWHKSNLNLLTTKNPPYNPLMASVNLRCIPCSISKEGK
jgi:anaerobic selenocysteine-containing dehydrogenase